MKPKEKRMIAILVIITVVVIAVFFITRNNKTNTATQSGGKATTNVETKENNEYATVLDDGTRQNTSNKLKETKTFDGMEVSGLQLTEKDNLTTLLGTVTNKSNSTKGGYSAVITFLDKDGKEIKTIEAYIPSLEPNKSTQLSANGTFDGANAYDFTIKQK